MGKNTKMPYQGGGGGDDFVPEGAEEGGMRHSKEYEQAQIDMLLNAKPRQSWEEYKATSKKLKDDRLENSAEADMLAYRKMLDAEREKNLARGRNRADKKDKKERSSKKKESKKNKRSSKRKKRSDDSSSSSSSEGENEDETKKDGSAGPVRLSALFNESDASGDSSSSDSEEDRKRKERKKAKKKEKADKKARKKEKKRQEKEQRKKQKSEEKSRVD